MRDNIFILNEYLQVLVALVESKLNDQQRAEIHQLIGHLHSEDPVSFNKSKKVLDICFDVHTPTSLAFLFGNSLKPSKHGFYGYAVKSAANLGEAINIIAKHQSTRSTIFQINLIREGDDAVVVLDENIARNHYTDFIMASMLFSWVHTSVDMFRKIKLPSEDLDNISTISLKMQTKAPKIPGLNLRFSHYRNEIRFKYSYLKLPLSTRDDDLNQLTLKQIGEDSATDSNASLIQLVRSFVERDYGLSYTLDDLADEMCVSPRTLKRRLSDAKISYREILKQARKEKAIALLTQGTKNIDVIAEEVGYSDTSNFCKAFKNWTGSSPTQYRENS